MRELSIRTLKFVGTIGLGLLTGVSYTASTQSLPALYTLPNAAAANRTATQHRRLTTYHVRLLSGLSISAYFLAFLISPPRARHPYLLWASLIAGLGAGVDFIMNKTLDIEKKLEDVATSATASDDEDYERLDQSIRLNGEEVRKTIEGWRLQETVRAGLSGLAFTMGVVGIWGDGLRKMT